MRSLIIAFLLAATPVFCETYSWEDKQGVMHFSDRAESVPSGNKGKVTIRKDIEKPKVMSTNDQIEERMRTWKPTVLKVGMSIYDVVDELGMWSNKNTSQGAYGTRIQYVFNNRGRWYVYTTNDKVTSWQNNN